MVGKSKSWRLGDWHGRPEARATRRPTAPQKRVGRRSNSVTLGPMPTQKTTNPTIQHPYPNHHPPNRVATTNFHDHRSSIRTKQHRHRARMETVPRQPFRATAHATHEQNSCSFSHWAMAHACVRNVPIHFQLSNCHSGAARKIARRGHTKDEVPTIPR